MEQTLRDKLSAVAGRLLLWADEIDNCAEGAHAGINASIQSLRAEADAIHDLLAVQHSKEQS